MSRRTLIGMIIKAQEKLHASKYWRFVNNMTEVVFKFDGILVLYSIEDVVDIATSGSTN